MCEWGTDVEVEVTIPADLSHTREPRKASVKIDSCIAPVVGALEAGGVLMRGSCCGHGKSDGYIALQDGRYLLILPNRDEAVTRRRYSYAAAESAEKLAEPEAE